MSWTWRLERADGTRVDDAPPVPALTNQSDAETWLGENWRELADAGIAQTTLFEGERRVYGPMSLADG